MHDVFDPALETAGNRLGLHRVPAMWATAAQQAKGFTIATNTEPWVYKGSVHVLANLELDTRRDSLHHRSSGLDTTSAKLAARAGILIAINLANLRTLDPTTLGRVQQNITLCRQHGARMCVLSAAKTAEELPHEPDVRSLLVTLGMSPGEARAAITALGKAWQTFEAKHRRQHI